MAYRSTTQGDPVQLGDPTEPPNAFPGCDVCAALLKQWRMASAPTSPAHDVSHATDLAVEISRHPHKRAVRS